MRRVAQVLSLLTAATLSLCATRSVMADPAVYEAGVDPGVGVNLISWWNFGASGAQVWEDAVQDIYDQGLRAVSISPLRFVDLSTGAVRLSDGSTTGPDMSHISAGVVRAASLGMSITINPFIEPDHFSMWRALMNFSGAAKTQFWSDYQAYLVEVATVAQAHGVARMTIGTELNALVADAGHNPNWNAAIAAVDAVFSGQIGYAANWDAYRNANLTSTIWEHASIGFMGVDTYVPLATDAQAVGIGNPAVALLETSWLSVLDNPAGGFAHGILAYAAARKGGAGMPLVMTEHGSIPFDKTTVQPFSTAPGGGATDPYEQVNDYVALMRAADQRAAVPLASGRLDEIHIWQWQMPGADGSLWLLHPDGDLITTGAKAAQFLTGFVTGDVPAVGAPLDSAEQDCVNGLNKRLAGVVKVQGKDSYKCLRDGARGQLGGLSVDDCLTADRRDRVAKAQQKTIATAATDCAGIAPDFGPTSATTINQAAVDGGVALVHDALGADIDATLFTETANANASRCQQFVVRTTTRCLDERVKEFNRCKKAALRDGAGTASDLAICIGADPDDRIAKRCDRIGDEIAKKCTALGVALAVAFPPCGSANAAVVETCLTNAAAQRACSVISTSDALGLACP